MSGVCCCFCPCGLLCVCFVAPWWSAYTYSLKSNDPTLKSSLVEDTHTNFFFFHESLYCEAQVQIRNSLRSNNFMKYVRTYFLNYCTKESLLPTSLEPYLCFDIVCSIATTFRPYGIIVSRAQLCVVSFFRYYRLKSRGARVRVPEKRDVHRFRVYMYTWLFQLSSASVYQDE